MLVDLGRNDVGRVARDRHASRSPSAWSIERYSHVMHLVSNVRGRLAAGLRLLRRLSRHVPGRHALRRAEDPRHGDHRGARAGAARRLRRRRRLLRLRRRHGHLHRHPHHGHRGRDGLRPGRRRHRRRLRPRARARGVRQQGARACCRRSSWRSSSRMVQSHAPDDRQLRLVHLQPRPVPRRARRRRRACTATTRSRSTRSRRWRPSGIVISPGPCTPNEAGISVPADRALRRPDPDPRRLPRPPVHRRRLRRRDRARRRASCTARRRRSITTAAASFAGSPNPFEATRYHSLVIERADAAGRALEVIGLDRRGRDHGRAAPRASASRACSSIPSRS